MPQQNNTASETGGQSPQGQQNRQLLAVTGETLTCNRAWAWKTATLGLGLAAMLAFSGCANQNTQRQNGNPGGSQFPNANGAMFDSDSIRGIVAETTGSSITIAQMPQGQMIAGGGRVPNGEDRQAEDGDTPRTRPRNGSDNPRGIQGSPDPDFDPSNGPMNPIDTSSFPKITYIIDSKTTITRSPGPDDSAQKPTAIGVEDIEEGEMVSITTDEKNETIAKTITVMSITMGSMPQGNAPQILPQPSAE